MAVVERLLAAILDKTGRRWKTTIGLLAAGSILLSGQLGWIDEETAQRYVDYALLLTGIGLLHKTAANGGAK